MDHIADITNLTNKYLDCIKLLVNGTRDDNWPENLPVILSDVIASTRSFADKVKRLQRLNASKHTPKKYYELRTGVRPNAKRSFSLKLKERSVTATSVVLTRPASRELSPEVSVVPVSAIDLVDLTLEADSNCTATREMAKKRRVTTSDIRDGRREEEIDGQAEVSHVKMKKFHGGKRFVGLNDGCVIN